MAGRSKKTGKDRLDKYYHLAKSQGYRARSAFKLIQINKKYGFLEKSRVLVDLCAAPGGWLQVAAKYMPVSSIIVGVDLDAIKPIPRVITHVEDITTASCHSTLQKDLKNWKADVVLHDGAPNVGTAWVQDAYDQSTLVLSALKLAVSLLAKGGTFVTKVFRSRDYTKLLWCLGLFFEKVEATKPPSSRNVSAELFVVCRGFLAPKKIDPRTLDPKFVFQEVDETKDEDDEKADLISSRAAMNQIMFPEKAAKKRQRDGYDETVGVLFKKTSVLEFLTVNKELAAVQLLAANNTFTFEDMAEECDIKLKDVTLNPLTTPEIRDLCTDLKVLGRKDFKILLKWRKQIRELLLKQDEPVEDVVEVDNMEVGEDAELAELEHLNEQDKLQVRRLKKKRLEKLAKNRRRVQLNMTTPMDLAEGDLQHLDDGMYDGDTTQASLFDLRKVKNSTQVDEDYSDADESVEEASGDEEDSDFERAQQIEDNVDQMYDDYMQKQISRDPKLMIKQKRAQEEEFTGFSTGANQDSSDSEPETSPAQVTKSKKAELFFDKDVFQDADLDSSEDEDFQDEDVSKKVQAFAHVSEEEDALEEVDEDVEDQKAAQLNERVHQTLGSPYAVQLAMSMVRDGRRNREDVLEAEGYNRYSNNMDGDLPKWFLDDELQFNRPSRSENVTKEAVQMFKDRQKALGDRPIKKVLEAKARKKQKAIRKLDKLKKKMNHIMEEDNDKEFDPEMSTKLSEMQKMMRSAARKSKEATRRKVEVVPAKNGNRATKGRPKGVKGRYKMVDQRMKKEVLAEKRKKSKSKKR